MQPCAPELIVAMIVSCSLLFDLELSCCYLFRCDAVSPVALEREPLRGAVPAACPTLGPTTDRCAEAVTAHRRSGRFGAPQRWSGGPRTAATAAAVASGHGTDGAAWSPGTPARQSSRRQSTGACARRVCAQAARVTVAPRGDGAAWARRHAGTGRALGERGRLLERRRFARRALGQWRYRCRPAGNIPARFRRPATARRPPPGSGR